ncbi:MAG: calcium/sodium antiporter [Opitutales bacterium]
MVYFWLLIGLILLVLGAEVLIRGASRLAAGLGLPPLVIGLTVVAYGTSAPELAVSIKAGLTGEGAVAVGNVIGSNIFNVLFILGLCALVAPLTVASKLIRLDVPIMILASFVILFLGFDGVFARREGLLLVVGLVAYTVFLVVAGRKEQPAVDLKDTVEPEPGNPWLQALIALVGLGILVAGSRLFVGGAIALARVIGLSESVIGLTIVAAGTSLPEVVTSVVATIRGKREIAVGNVIGSNTFNILGVLGLSSLFGAGGFLAFPAAMLHFDLPVMIIVALACLPVFLTGGRISRSEGAVLFGYYLLYTLYLILASSQHDALPAYSKALFWFIIPLNLATWVFVALVLKPENRPEDPHPS